MKKTLFFATVGCMLLASCATEPSYTFVGTAPADVPDGGMVYLLNAQKAVLDSAVIQNHTFTFKGRQDSVVERIVDYKKDSHSFSANLFLENANIQLSYADGQCNVTGTPTNEAYYAFMNKYTAFNKEMNQVFKQTRAENVSGDQMKELYAKMNQLRADRDAFIKESISAHINDAMGVVLLPKYGRSFDDAQQKEWILQLPESKRNAKIQKMLSRIEKRENTAVGKKFVDFSMTTPEGKEHKLSEFVAQNKLTLLDFWASWCGPCRGEMPNVVKAYKIYHKKGFGIVSVSLDDNAERWTKAIKNLKMDWVNLSDLKGWACEGSQHYGVTGIPATVLIDQDGTIIARSLRGEELHKTLEKLLK